jgi:hypothetical protein
MIIPLPFLLKQLVVRHQFILLALSVPARRLESTLEQTFIAVALVHKCDDNEKVNERPATFVNRRGLTE